MQRAVGRGREAEDRALRLRRSEDRRKGRWRALFPKSAAAARARRRGPRARRRPSAGAPARRRPKAIYHPGPPIDCEAALDEATARPARARPRARRARSIAVGGPPPLRRREPGFAGLAAIIVSQQVSVASANAIFGRLEAEFAPLGAASVIAADDAALKRCGLSQPKMRALRALAEATAERPRSCRARRARRRDAHRALVAVKGIGPWTADIFLLFCLGHPDAFPAGDLALAGGGADRARASRPAPTRGGSRGSPNAGGPCAASRRACCGPITAASNGAPASSANRIGARGAFALDPPRTEVLGAPHDGEIDRTAPRSQGRPRQAARGVPARLRRRRQRPDRARPAMARAAARGRFRLAARARALRRLRRWAGNGSP